MTLTAYFKSDAGIKVLTVGLIVALLLIFPLIVKSNFYLHLLILTFIMIIMTSSLRLIATSGQVSLGQGGIMSIGAYSSAVVSKSMAVTPWLTMPFGAVLTMGIAYLASFPFSRLRGIYYSMITLFFGMFLLTIGQVFTKYTGGYSGYTGIPPLFTGSKVPYYFAYLFLCLVCLAVMYRLEHSRTGAIWKAIAQSPSVALSIGINDPRQRRLVYTIGCLFAGIAGAAYAHYQLVLSQDTFGFLASLNLIVYMMVGGINSFAGPIIGTSILVIIPALFRELREYVPYVSAVILLIVLIFMPNGLAGLPAQISQTLKNRRNNLATVKKG